MSPNPVSIALSGSLFGSALLVSGVYSPIVIMDQLLLRDFHMLKVFLTASASSAIYIFIARKSEIAPCISRKPSNLNRFHQYDGNIIGGGLLGGGMGLTGACPGTILVQIATGASSGLYVLGGAVLGGIVWTRFQHLARLKAPAASVVSKDDGPNTEKGYTVYEAARMTETQGVLIYGLLCSAMIAFTSYLTPHPFGSPRLNPIIGGLAIGSAQAASLILTGSAIGVSGAYESIGKYCNRILGFSPSNKDPWPSTGPIIFVLGVLGGSWSLGNILDLKIVPEAVPISRIRAIIGGVALVVGARIAGGCTSGHGISGMATLSKSSFVTVAAMFAGGIAISGLLGYF